MGVFFLLKQRKNIDITYQDYFVEKILMRILQKKKKGGKNAFRNL